MEAAAAVHAVRRAHDLVVLPALAVAVLPGAVLARRHTMAIVTLTAMNPGEGDVVFMARDETGLTVLSAKDKFVER